MIFQSLSQMRGLDLFTPGQIRNRACQLENTKKRLPFSPKEGVFSRRAGVQVI
jgi:hypothetical protein